MANKEWSEIQGTKLIIVELCMGDRVKRLHDYPYVLLSYDRFSSAQGDLVQGS